MPNGDLTKVTFAGEPTPAAAPTKPTGDGVIDTNVNPNNVTPPATTPDPNRPAWLPEKFANVEDMAKAYGELEKKLSGKPAATPPSQTPPSQTPPSQNPPAGEQSAPPEFAVFAEEYSTNGKLSDESYKKLETDHKLPREYVDAYLTGMTAVAEKQLAEIHAAANGADNYNKMIQWASVNLTPEEIAAYDKTVTGGDLEAVKLAAKGLYAQYTSKMGSDPKLIHGDGSTTGDNLGFQSRAEMVEAMKDPRYQKDPAYRKAVAYKISKSNY